MRHFPAGRTKSFNPTPLALFRCWYVILMFEMELLKPVATERVENDDVKSTQRCFNLKCCKSFVFLWHRNLFCHKSWLQIASIKSVSKVLLYSWMKTINILISRLWNRLQKFPSKAAQRVYGSLCAVSSIVTKLLMPSTEASTSSQQSLIKNVCWWQ